MQTTTAAFLIDRQDGEICSELVSLPVSSLEAESPWVLIEAHYSSIGYKDALAATGRGRILRRFPLIGGQDVAGRVVASEDPAFSAGDEVVITGHGLGETHNGGLAEMVRVPSSWPVKIPAGLSMFDTMALSTAGFTAAQAIVMMEHDRQRPELGPVVVTGATGGVGSVRSTSRPRGSAPRSSASATRTSTRACTGCGPTGRSSRGWSRSARRGRQLAWAG